MKALYVFIAIVVIAFAAIIAMLLMGDGGGPSCEERGGRRVLSHMSPIFSGKTVIMVPVYRCQEVAP